MCHLPYNWHLHSQWARLRHTKFACHIACIVVALALTGTRRFLFCFVYFTVSINTLVAELRSSAMSGATDRREDEQVPQFYGRIDEKFAEWEIDVRFWQVEFKLEYRDRLGPKLYRRGLHGQPKIIVKTKLGTQDVVQFTVDNIIKCLKDNGYGELLEELGQEALDNYFDMKTLAGGQLGVIGDEGGYVWVSHRATAIECAKEQLRMASPAEREMREMLMRIGGDGPDGRSKHGVPRQQDLTQQSQRIHDHNSFTHNQDHR